MLYSFRSTHRDSWGISSPRLDPVTEVVVVAWMMMYGPGSLGTAVWVLPPMSVWIGQNWLLLQPLMTRTASGIEDGDVNTPVSLHNAIRSRKCKTHKKKDIYLIVQDIFLLVRERKVL